MGVTNQGYLEALANLEARDAWLEDTWVEKEKKLNFVQYLVLSERLGDLATNIDSDSTPSTRNPIYSVLDFLRSFRPPLTHCATCFEEVGIVTIPDLQEHARSENPIGVFGRFVQSGDMSPLELRMLEEGLDELARGNLL